MDPRTGDPMPDHAQIDVSEEEGPFVLLWPQPQVPPRPVLVQPLDLADS
jgi:hypothetical protein